MNQLNKILLQTHNATGRPLRKIAPLALVVGVALFIAYGLAGTAHAQAESGAIPSLTLDSNEPGQLVINWQAPEQAPTDYRIRWAHTSLEFLSYKDSDEAQRGNVYPAGGVTTLTLNGLTPGEDYKVQMRSRYYNADRSVHQSSGPWTATATFQVMEEPADTPPPQPTPGPTLPAAPTGLTASQVSHDSLTLVWDDPQDENVTGYRVMRGTHNDSLLTIEANTGSTSTEYTDTTVTAETTYFYAVLSLSADGDGPQSSTVNVTTSAEPQVDLAPPPTDLTTTRVTHDSLTLTWNAPRDTTVSGYRILRGTTYKELSTIEDDTKNTNTQYTDSGLSEATTYFYAVNALTPDGQSSRTHLEANTPAELINAQPALSNDPATQTLISNMDRATAIMQSTITRDLAQEFKTGTNPNKYKLSSIDLFLTGYSSPETVKIYRGDHREKEVTVGTGSFFRPEVVIEDDPVATMTTSSWSQGHDVYTFTPPANTMLDPNTSYWIVVKDNGNPWFKAAPGEDVTPAEGWTISDKYQYRSKYRWDEDGNHLTNTDPAFRTTNGSLTMRINRVNNAATGVPTISGTPQTQQTLTASAAGIQDDDGLPATFNYQWMRYSADGTSFEANVGTNSPEYTLGLDDENKKLRVAVTFMDDANNDEGPILSNAYPSAAPVRPPPFYNMVSNTGQTPDGEGTISNSSYAQAFTTGSNPLGYILTSATVLSKDTDDFTVKVCGVTSDTHPTTSCTNLVPPTSFAAGPMVFSSPVNSTIPLLTNTTYALVLTSPGGEQVELVATDSANEDPLFLPNWSIRDVSQYYENGQWKDRSYDYTWAIAVNGNISNVNPALGMPHIVGYPSVGQRLTALTDRIVVPEGSTSRFSYQWKRYSQDGFTFEADIGTNLNQYTLTPDDLNKRIVVTATFIDANNHFVGFPLYSPAYPASVVSEAPNVSNTSQSGQSTTPVSRLLSQTFTTGPKTHGYTVSQIHIFYQHTDRQPVDMKICRTSRNGAPTDECEELASPRQFSTGYLRYSPKKQSPIVLDRNTAYAVQFNWRNDPNKASNAISTRSTRACVPEPDFPCTAPIIITPDKLPPEIGVTTGNGEDTFTNAGWSIGNAYKEYNGSWRNTSSGASIQITIDAAVTPNVEATGSPAIEGTARVGYTIDVSTEDIEEPNGKPDVFTYQWKRYSADGATLEAEISTAPTYTLTSSDVGKNIKVEVSFTDLGNYSEGPLASAEWPYGVPTITSLEDDLLVANVGYPLPAASITGRVNQSFTTGKNPNGYVITSISVPDTNISVSRICRFESQHNASPSLTLCFDPPTPDDPKELRGNWLYGVELDAGSGSNLAFAETGQTDPTSPPHWTVRGKYQVLNQGAWQSAETDRAIRIEIHGQLRSAIGVLGQITATPGNRQASLTWHNFVGNRYIIIDRIQYRMRQLDQQWNLDWTDIPRSNDQTESYTFTNLTNGIEHTIELRAVFIIEEETVYGGAAPVSTTPRAPLTAPLNMDASTAGDSGVTLNWSDPADSTLTGYEYRYHHGDNVWNPDWTTIRGSNALTTSHAFTKLQKNIRYTFEVRTIRDTNQGPASSSSVTPRGPLPSLQNLTASADDRQVMLSWDNPGEHGITGYQYRYRVTSESIWNPDWTNIPSSRANTTSYTVRRLAPSTSHTFEIRVMRGQERGPPVTTQSSTPSGPATVPQAPRNPRISARGEGFTLSWGLHNNDDERAPVTSFKVRHREIGTSSWRNVTVTVTAQDCCELIITRLRNRHHYEAQVAAVNRLGTGPWADPDSVTPQAPISSPPSPIGDPDRSLSYLNLYWHNSNTGNNLWADTCKGDRSFRIIWDGPHNGHPKKADEWAAHINTIGHAGEVTYRFTKSPGIQEYYELNGTVHFHGKGRLEVSVRGRFGSEWGTWQRGILYCRTDQQTVR